MNNITLTDGQLNLLEIALVQSLKIKKTEAKHSLERGDLISLTREIDEIRQIQSLANLLPVKI